MSALRPVDPDALSALACTRFVLDDGSRAPDVLLVGFAGTYRPGSQGRDDGRFIKAKTIESLVAFDPSCLVLDLSALNYVWGDGLLGVFQSIAELRDAPGVPTFPVLVVTSERCRAALLGLFGTTESDASWHFRTRDAALAEAPAAAQRWLDA